jgi:7,8-dihydropterin-6-yl-methyl-4-(beta-D-ribofuranosyl)aminobenzene 5'-phosphate synthase
MIITTLVENTRPAGRKDLIAEKGLSLHVQSGNQNILFDTGVKNAVCENAQKLGVDLSAVDLTVISHHHYDHGGGLSLFLKENNESPVYLRNRRDEEYYTRFLGIFKEYIGLDEELFYQHPGRFVFVDQFSEISPGVFILTDIGQSHPRPKGNRLLFSKQGDAWKPDTFDHELILVIEEDDGLVAFTGCAHRGILNMIEAVRTRFPDVPIKAVLGGFHQILYPVFDSMAGSRSEVEELGRALNSYPIERIYTGHCTGQKAYRILSEVMGEKLAYLPTGSVIEID